MPVQLFAIQCFGLIDVWHNNVSAATTGYNDEAGGGQADVNQLPDYTVIVDGVRFDRRCERQFSVPLLPVRVAIQCRSIPMAPNGELASDSAMVLDGPTTVLGAGN